MIKNARIVSRDTNPASYHTQKVEDRGKPEYAVSSSDLKLFVSRCPSWWKNGGTLKESASFDFGDALDTLALTPTQFEARFAVQPTSYLHKTGKCPKCGSVSDSGACRKCKCEREPAEIEKPWTNQSNTCSEWSEEQEKAGRKVISQQMMKDATAAKQRLMDDAQCSAFIAGCDKQVLIQAEWHDEKTGLVIPIRCLIDLASRPDGLFPKAIGDLKTTILAAPVQWANQAHKIGYDIQAAFNTDMFVAATDREITNFCFIIVENTFPFEIGRRYMEQSLDDPQDMGDIASGRRQYSKIMADYCQCVKRGEWPVYDSTDESSATGWTLVSPNPYDEHRRMFAPKIQFIDETGEPETAPTEDPSGDVIP